MSSKFLNWLPTYTCEADNTLPLLLRVPHMVLRSSKLNSMNTTRQHGNCTVHSAQSTFDEKDAASDLLAEAVATASSGSAAAESEKESSQTAPAASSDSAAAESSTEPMMEMRRALR